MYPEFATEAALQQQIDTYFITIEGEYHFEELQKKTKDNTEFSRQKVWDRESQPATLSGLILFLGFNSRQDFDNYENKGPYAGALKRGRLRIEAEYEKKLHYQSSTGAIFALKNLGWEARPEETTPNEVIKKIQVEIINSGHTPTASENEVII